MDGIRSNVLSNVVQEGMQDLRLIVHHLLGLSFLLEILKLDTTLRHLETVLVRLAFHRVRRQCERRANKP